jgi:hypothetical protein
MTNTTEYPRCGAHKPGFGPGVGANRQPCVLPVGHAGVHRNVMHLAWTGEWTAPTSGRTCAAQRPGFGSAYQTCLRPAGHRDHHATANGMRWWSQDVLASMVTAAYPPCQCKRCVPVGEPVTGAAARALGEALRAQLSGKGEA